MHTGETRIIGTKMFDFVPIHVIFLRLIAFIQFSFIDKLFNILFEENQQEANK